MISFVSYINKVRNWIEIVRSCFVWSENTHTKLFKSSGETKTRGEWTVLLEAWMRLRSYLCYTVRNSSKCNNYAFQLEIMNFPDLLTPEMDLDEEIWPFFLGYSCYFLLSTDNLLCLKPSTIWQLDSYGMHNLYKSVRTGKLRNDKLVFLSKVEILFRQCRIGCSKMKRISYICNA